MLPIMCGLWANVAVDLLVVIVLTFNLKKKQRGMTERLVFIFLVLGSVES
jgi:hypothetical protein